MSSATEYPTSSWLPESVAALLAAGTKLKYIVYTHAHWVSVTRPALQLGIVVVGELFFMDFPDLFMTGVFLAIFSSLHIFRVPPRRYEIFRFRFFGFFFYKIPQNASVS